MSKSLQDQLLSAQLIDSKKAKKISKENRKAKSAQLRNKEHSMSEAQAAAAKAQKEKLERDNELNRQRNQAAEDKAIAAQVVQLIEHYRIARQAGDMEYNFKDGKVIKKIRVTEEVSEEIIRGRLCIARLKEAYEIIPRPIADKIRERDNSSVVVYNDKAAQASTSSESDDDYYAQFEIPDDLDW